MQARLSGGGGGPLGRWGGGGAHVPRMLSTQALYKGRCICKKCVFIKGRGRKGERKKNGGKVLGKEC